MSGGGGNQTNWQQVAYENAYNAARQGQPMQHAIGNQPGYADATRMAYADFRATRNAHSGGHEGWGHHGSGFEMHYDTGPSYEERMADQEAQYRKQLEDQRRMQGETDRDTLYGSYLSAVSTAQEYITQQINDERANARLLGIDYDITPEQQQTRTQDYFATIWSSGDQARLEALVNEWGAPTGFQGYTLARGNPDNYTSSTEASETSQGTSRPLRPTLATEEEDRLGTTQTVLGV